MTSVHYASDHTLSGHYVVGTAVPGHDIDGASARALARDYDAPDRPALHTLSTGGRADLEAVLADLQSARDAADLAHAVHTAYLDALVKYVTEVATEI